jgi:hypothetical protein
VAEAQQLPQNDDNNIDHDNKNDDHDNSDDHEEEEEEDNEAEEEYDEDYTLVSNFGKEEMCHESEEIKTPEMKL